MRCVHSKREVRVYLFIYFASPQPSFKFSSTLLSNGLPTFIYLNPIHLYVIGN